MNYWVEVACNMRVPLQAVRVPLRVILAVFRAYVITAQVLVRRIVVASCAVPTDALHCPRG